MLDSDVCIDHLRGAFPLSTWSHAAYSVITRCELYAGQHANEPRLDRFLGRFEELLLDRRIAESAGRLRRELRLDTPDALIAATALEHDLVLVTRNRRDFEDVRGIRLRDPSSLT